MPEFRKDLLSGRWVVMAPERALRPMDFEDGPALLESTFDPFAEGNERHTPPEILAYRPSGEPNSPGWTVRVVPNQFPAVQAQGLPDPRVHGIYQSMNGAGAHEVIIECPHREPNFGRLSVSNIADVLSIYRDRLRDLKQDSRLAHALIFKNQGALAGASVHHSHSQLIATPFVPIAIEDELAAADDFLHKEGHNLFEAIVQQELADEHRLILQTDHYVAFCPYASRFAYESWIVPRRSGSHFESSGDADLQELAPVLKSVLNRLDQNLKNPALNYVLHSAPLHQPDLPYYRWHLKILPRLTRVAGFEWGSGCYINEVLPEHAARQLREPAV